MNERGEKEAENGNSNVLNTFVSFVNSFISEMTEDTNSLLTVVRAPYIFYDQTGKRKSNNTAAAIIELKNVEAFVNSWKEFNFKKCLDKYLNKNEAEDIYNNYVKLCDFLDE